MWHQICLYIKILKELLTSKGGNVHRKKIGFTAFVLLFFFMTIKTYAGVIYSSNFDNQDVSCWNKTSSDWRSKCGDFEEIGKGPAMQLSKLHSKSGSYAAVWRAKYNEERGQAYIRLASPMSYDKGYEELYIQMWNYYTGDDGTYDHATMPKNMRVNCSNGSTVAFDIIVTVNDNDSNRDSETIAIRYNGGPNDWKAAYGNYQVPNNKWVLFELRIKLNALGKSDGLVEFWVDGVPIARKDNINIRGNNNYKINNVLVGGWYSNSGKNSNQYNYRYIDDLVISTTPIGTGSSSTSSTTSINPPPAPTSIRVEGSTP